MLTRSATAANSNKKTHFSSLDLSTDENESVFLDSFSSEIENIKRSYTTDLIQINQNMATKALLDLVEKIIPNFSGSENINEVNRFIDKCKHIEKKFQMVKPTLSQKLLMKFSSPNSRVEHTSISEKTNLKHSRNYSKRFKTILLQPYRLS